MKKLRYVLICCLSCLSFQMDAGELTFSQISSRNGLSQNTVRAIVEDRNGFIWAGTLDGLNKYDGYNIRSYRHRIENYYFLKDHRIRDLFVDKNGYLWIKTYRNEFSCYDPLSDSFVDLKNSRNEPYIYESYYESSRGDVWLWDKNEGVLRLRNTAARSFEQKTLLQKLPLWKFYNFLLEDAHANIWVGGSVGLFKISGDEVITYRVGGKDYVYTLAVEQNNKIYFTTEESVLVIFDCEQHTFEEVPYRFSGVSLDAMIAVGDDKLLLISDSKEIQQFNVLTREFKKPEWASDPDFTKSVTTITSIVDKNKGIWLSNDQGFVWYCMKGEKQFRKKRLALDDYFILNMVHIDSSGVVWLTTYGSGLFAYDPMKDEFTNYRNDSGVNSLASNYLLCITEDRFGNIWLGSEYAGIIRVVKTPDYIRIVRPEKNTVIGKVNNVRAIFEDSRGNIWVGAKNGSLYVYNQELTEHKCIAEDINPYSLMEDEKHRMWVGTKNNGIYLYDLNTFEKIGNFRNRKDDPVSLSFDAIFHIMKDRKGRMWVATFGGGINLAKENNQTIIFQHFINGKGNKSLLRYLYQDSKGRIWAGSNDGLIRFDPDEIIYNPQAYLCYMKNFDQKNSLSSNDIKIIYEDADSTIWIGTAGGGLNKFVEATGTEKEQFLSFDSSKGMADNYVLGIMEHGDDLWISCENGLSKFNKKNYLVVTYQFSQKSFGNIFNEGAFCMRKDGRMMWGNLDGILVLDPDRFIPDKHLTPVLITGLQVNGMDWNDLKGNASEKSITFTDKIILAYNQNTFSIEFAMLTLRNPEKNKYTYLLDNYDKEWSVQSSANVATYRNLPYGKYVFKVKGNNADGEWNQETTTLSIIIQPPVWKSSLAYFFYFILLCVLLYIVFGIIRNSNRIKNEVEFEKQPTNHKLRFFTNISNEFCTLTLSGYQLLIIEGKDTMRDFLKDEFCKYMLVDTAEDGETGLQKAMDTIPDLIICDVMLPEMDGYEVTRQLKKDFQTCHIPVILLTAHSSLEHQMEGIESGADAYITKPFNLTYVVKRVMKLIEQRELLKKCYSKDFVIDNNLMSTDKDKLFFKKIGKILEDNFRNSNFTIDRFIELSGVRRTLFFRKVKSMTGFSPNEMIKIRRLNESAVLLKNSDLTVSEISYKVGFEDPYYFSKCFKSHFGKSPSQYQKD